MSPREGGLVRVRVQPRASRDEIVAWQDDTLRVRVAGLSLADVRARVAAVVTAVLLVIAMPAAADHLTLDPGARSSAPRPFDTDVDVRVDHDGFHIGGRVFGLGAWLRGRVREHGVTLDGHFQGRNFRLDAESENGRPRLRIETYPSTL